MAYREWNPGTDDAWLECWWTATREGGGSHRVVPDGCVDILVDPVAGRARVVGAMTRPVVLEGGPASWVAARFRPGRAVGLFPGRRGLGVFGRYAPGPVVNIQAGGGIAPFLVGVR